ncbi:MAG: redoxin domain-containing protein [Chloroflexia bacterium]|nr:redoxin domain-containing protein [Chloroflexia bacterium]MDQ3412784.1 redoxin domain-containing protein [Chloroflexota bacterium]
MKSATVPIGASAPDFDFLYNGVTARLSVLRGRVVVLVFFRGYWCQSCRRQLAQLGSAYDTIRSLDAELIAISAASSVPLEPIARGDDHEFPVVADADMRVIDVYGVRDRDDPEHPRLARPAVFILDAAGVVQFCHVGAHRQDRPALGSIMIALESIGDNRGF